MDNENIKEILNRLEYDKDNVYYVGYTDGVNIDNTLMPKDIKLLLDYITNLQEENKKYEEFVNELRKIVNGELVPRYHTNSERAKFHFNEGWSLFKSFVEDRMTKFIGEDKDENN